MRKNDKYLDDFKEEYLNNIKYLSLLKRFKGTSFSWNKAVTIVGGEERLKNLMEQEKVRYEKPFGNKNTMYRFNAVDVLKNVKAYVNDF